MAVTTTSIPFNIPPGTIESTGSVTMFLKCDTDSSGMGFSSGMMPLYSPSYEMPTGQLDLFLEARNQVGLWGHDLNQTWPSYTLESWSSWPSGSKAASGFIYSDLNMAVSGQRVISYYGVMPLYIPVDTTGNASGFLNLVTLNQEVATGEIPLFNKGHGLASSNTSLLVYGGVSAVSGSTTMVATGIGFSYGSTSLYMGVNPFTTSS